MFLYKTLLSWLFGLLAAFAHQSGSRFSLSYIGATQDIIGEPQSFSLTLSCTFVSKQRGAYCEAAEEQSIQRASYHRLTP